MKSKTKALLMVLCALMLVVASVLGTIAYLTDTETVTNTFTVGNVQIKLDEAKVKENGEVESESGSEERTTEGNAYHLLPGHTYVKDPTVTVLGGSEESYVRMMVTVNFSEELDAIFAPNGANLINIFYGYDETEWSLYDVTEDAENNVRTYEFRYKDTVAKAATDTALDPLFDKIIVPQFVDNEDLASLVEYGTDKDGNTVIVDQFTISITAHAIQADGFEDDDAAWAAFDAQN